MPKVVIDLDKPSRNLTFMLYGESRTGKTRFAATFPRPLIIADASERGYETVVWMKRNSPELFYDPAVAPEVWAVSNVGEMNEAFGDADSQLRANPWRWRTVVGDSLTFFGDTMMARIMEAMGDKFDNRRAYGDLGFKLNYLMTRANSLPVHMVWTALAKLPDVDEKGNTVGKAGILVAGQTADKAPARCNYWFYFRQAGGQYLVHTRKFGPFPAGGRDMGQLADPLPEASYRAVEEGLGIEPHVEKKTAAAPARGGFVAPRQSVNK